PIIVGIFFEISSVRRIKNEQNNFEYRAAAFFPLGNNFQSTRYACARCFTQIIYNFFCGNINVNNTCTLVYQSN
ncbi:MAG: hypothetical protein KDC67_02180, partial [Ignavibacteriae bacterium]|nr:hypothetical protein [Ignavibacteriota bacterium]